MWAVFLYFVGVSSTNRQQKIGNLVSLYYDWRATYKGLEKVVYKTSSL